MRPIDIENGGKRIHSSHLLVDELNNENISQYKAPSNLDKKNVKLVY